jgi:hypothetical protein
MATEAELKPPVATRATPYVRQAAPPPVMDLAAIMEQIRNWKPPTHETLGMGDIVRTNPRMFQNPPPRFPLYDYPKGELPVSEPEFNPPPGENPFTNYESPQQYARRQMSQQEADAAAGFTPEHQAAFQNELDLLKPKEYDNPFSKFIEEGERERAAKEDFGRLSADDFWRKYFEDLNPSKE